MTANIYTVSRNMRGDLQALTVVCLGFDRRELHITTHKSSPGLSCDATVFRITEDGRGREHAFGLGRPGSGDFRRTLSADRTARATEKAIRTMHAACIADLAPVLAAALAHYGKAPTPAPTLTPAQHADMDDTAGLLRAAPTLTPQVGARPL